MKSNILKSILYFTTFLFGINFSIGQNTAYISTEKAIEDINIIVKNIEETHYNPYFLVSKEQFHLDKNEVISNFNPDSIPLKKFIAVTMQLVAQMSGGHTAMDWQIPGIIPEIKSYYYIPITGKLSEDFSTFYVTKSDHPEIKAGMKIESINNENIVDLYEECMKYMGGIKSFKNASIQKTFPLYLFFTELISAPYSIKVSGKKDEIESPGLDISEFMNFVNQKIENYTFEIIEGDIGLITYNSCQDLKAFRKFAKNTFKLVQDKNITKLIIDIRENGGGNSDLNEVLLAYITETPYRQSNGRFWKVSEQAKKAYKLNSYEKYFGKEFMEKYYQTTAGSIIETFDDELVYPEKPKNYFSGKSCILIGPNTFSSANMLSDAVKTYKLSTLIGMSTGEYTNDYGEQVYFQLPNSEATVYVSSTYDIGADGDPEKFEPVHPDFKVSENVMEFAIEWMRE